MTKAEARALLKAHGLKIKDIAEYLGVQPPSITRRWYSGLDAQNILILHGFIALHSNRHSKIESVLDEVREPETLQLVQSCIRHKDNEVLQALIRDLNSRD